MNLKEPVSHAGPIEHARALLTETSKALDLAAGQIHFLRHQLTQAIAIMRLHNVPAQQLGPLLAVPNWKLIATGGNNKPGVIDNPGSCPCQHEYKVATVQTPIAAWPNPAVLNNCTNNLPAPAAAEWKCADDCVQVMTHIWHGWDVLQDLNTGKMVFNCNTYAQYHCKKPDDPDAHRPPRQTDPSDPTPDL